MRPARNERGKQCIAARASRHAAESFLHVEQAQIILAPFSDHHAMPPLIGIGKQAHGFLVKLALQVLGVGRDPHRCLVPARPEIGRREIAECLAEAGSGFGEKYQILFLTLAGPEGMGCGSRIVALGGAAFRIETEKLREKVLRLLRLDRQLRAGRSGPVIIPFVKPVPHIEAGCECVRIEPRISRSESREHRGCPGPVGAG